MEHGARKSCTASPLAMTDRPRGVFKFGRNKQGKWVETILYDFPDCLQGCMVEGTLALDGAGNLYGTAAGGMNSCAGFSCGVVFRLAPQANGTWKYNVLVNFSE